MDSQEGSAPSTGVVGAQTPSNPARTSLSPTFPGPWSVVMKSRHLKVRGDIYAQMPFESHSESVVSEEDEVGALLLLGRVRCVG